MSNLKLSEPQPDEEKRNGAREGLDEQDLPVGRDGSVRAGDNDAAEEEQLDLGSEFRHRVRDAPDQSRGQEAVVQALVRRQRRGLLGEVGRQAERLAAARGVPEEHLQDQDVDVYSSHDAAGGVRNDSHGGVRFAGLDFVEMKCDFESR